METVESPCVNICRLNSERFCVGCGRTGEEIAQWLAASESQRLAIRQAASARLKSVQQLQNAVSHE
jgi:predicted Fe-S protein YdhL (DUF1289 family)